MSPVQGKRTQRGCFDASKVGLKEVEAIRMAKDVLDALRQVLEEGVQSSKLYQHPWPLGFLVSTSVASVGVQVYLDFCLIFLLLSFILCIHSFLHFSLMVWKFLRRWC